MKNHIIISLLFLSVGLSQQKKTDEPNPMKGVKTETESKYKYEEKFGEFKEISKGLNFSHYDSNGNKVEETNYDSDGSLKFNHIFKYDSNGNLVEETNYNSEGVVTTDIMRGFAKMGKKFLKKNGTKMVL